MLPSPHRETDLHYDTVIIGSSLEAMATAYKYGITIFCDKRLKPLPFTYVPSDLDLSPLDVDNKIESFKFLSGNTQERGMQQLELWNLLAYRLQMMGLMPFSGNYVNKFMNSIPDGEGIRQFSIVVNGKYINIKPKRAILFDYPKYELGKKIFYVNDYVDIKTVYNFPANLFLSNDCDFMGTICFETIFYKRSARLHGCVAKSVIREDNIDKWGYSQTSIRMKMERDIFWNIDKEIKIKLGDRESAPMLTKMYESLEDVIHFDCMDGEIYD